MSSLPRNHLGSVRHEMQSAPAFAYSLAISRYLNSGSIIPFEGDAFLTSQINESPSFFNVFSNIKLSLEAPQDINLSVSSFSLLRDIFFLSCSTLTLAYCESSSSIFPISKPFFCIPAALCDLTVFTHLIPL